MSTKTRMETVKALEWNDGELLILDQRKLPGSEVWIRTTRVEVVAKAIESLAVRGAPVIGIAAAYGVALAALEKHATPRKVQTAIERLRRTRPTGFNLFHDLALMEATLMRAGDRFAEKLTAKALQIHRNDARSCLAMAKHGLELLDEGEQILTYCNTGALATGGIGTALGVIKHGFRKGRVSEVFACETRPVGQGARLTIWECTRAGIPVTLICDNMAAALLRSGRVTRVLTGADRVARNGDSSNKIGTLSLAMLAHEAKVPFHIVAPLSTFDLSLRSGKDIPIEERDRIEIVRSTPGLERVSGFQVWNPAFDVTPARYITSHITDAGVLNPPFEF